MKNLKRFDEFSRELNEYYSGLGGYSTRGSYGYEPPSSLGGFKDTFGTGKKLFGAGGILGRDRDGLRGGNKEVARQEWAERVKGRWKSKKGFLDHLMGKGGKGEGGEAPEDFKGGDVSRLKGAGGSPAAAAAAAADSGDSGDSGAAGAPQSQTPASVPSGVGVATSDNKWKSLVAALSGIKPKPFISPERGGPAGIPGGKVQDVDWSKFSLHKTGMKKEDAERFPLFIPFNNVGFIGDQGKFYVSSMMDETRPGEQDTSKDIGIAERIDDFWRKKNYRVFGPKKNSEGKNRTDSNAGKFAIVSIYFDINDPNRLKTDLQEMLNKFGVLTSTQRSA